MLSHINEAAGLQLWERFRLMILGPPLKPLTSSKEDEAVDTEQFEEDEVWRMRETPYSELIHPEVNVQWNSAVRMDNIYSYKKINV